MDRVTDDRPVHIVSGLSHAAGDSHVKEMKGLGLVMPDNMPDGVSLRHVMFAAELPVSMYRLAAAAASDEDMVMAMNFVMRNGMVTDVRPVRIDVTFKDYNNGVLAVAGKAVDFDEVAGGRATWLFAWEDEEWLYDPVPGMNGADGNMFWASFELDEAKVKDGKLKIRIVTEKAG